MILRHWENPKVVCNRVNLGVGEINPINGKSKGYRSSMRREIQKETVELWINVTKGTHTI